jgi:hypothetical protein
MGERERPRHAFTQKPNENNKLQLIEKTGIFS